MNDEIEDWLNSDVSKDYFELIRFQSVGADPAHLRDCVQCAMWLKGWLRKTGAEVELIVPSSGGGAGSSAAAGCAAAVPIVYAERKGDADGPTMLIYGHYDVQPVEPLAAWKTPPFEPTVVGDRVYARGAQDDKGQFFAFLNGVMKSEKKPNLKIILDGQEESESRVLTELLKDPAFRGRIAADALLVCDTSAAAGLRPAIVAGLRGVAHFTVRLTGANRDLHSGEYGGIAPNAAQEMAELLASLHNPDGSIAVPGFRDGIEPPGCEELRLAEIGMLPEHGGESASSLADIEAMYERDIGCPPCGGQIGKTIVQRNGFEPTIEINGMWSGHTGAGAKTIIPAEAWAKLSMRLVPGQSPRGCFDAVKAHLEGRCPKGLRVELTEVDLGTPGFRLPIASPLFRLARELLAELDPRGPVFMWDGASIPVVSLLREASGAAPLIVGWGQPGDRIHSPNESYSVRQFKLAEKWGETIAGAF